MPRRLFLHIGTPRSGTTPLQEKLALNRELVAEQGLLAAVVLTVPAEDSAPARLLARRLLLG